MGKYDEKTVLLELLAEQLRRAPVGGGTPVTYDDLIYMIEQTVRKYYEDMMAGSRFLAGE